MLIAYLRAAMSKAKYEILPDDRTYYGEIPGFEGVYANAATLEACRDELESTLEDWILFRVSRNLPLPEAGGVKLEVVRIRDSHLLRSDVKARHDKMVELVTRMIELKKQQARAPKKQSPSARQLLDQKLAIKEGLPPTADSLQLTASVGYDIRNTPERLAVSRKPMAPLTRWCMNCTG